MMKEQETWSSTNITKSSKRKGSFSRAMLRLSICFRGKYKSSAYTSASTVRKDDLESIQNISGEGDNNEKHDLHQRAVLETLPPPTKHKPNKSPDQSSHSVVNMSSSATPTSLQSGNEKINGLAVAAADNVVPPTENVTVTPEKKQASVKSTSVNSSPAGSKKVGVLSGQEYNRLVSINKHGEHVVGDLARFYDDLGGNPIAVKPYGLEPTPSYLNLLQSKGGTTEPLQRQVGDISSEQPLPFVRPEDNRGAPEVQRENRLASPGLNKIKEGAIISVEEFKNFYEDIAAVSLQREDSEQRKQQPESSVKKCCSITGCPKICVNGKVYTVTSSSSHAQSCSSHSSLSQTSVTEESDIECGDNKHELKDEVGATEGKAISYHLTTSPSELSKADAIIAELKRNWSSSKTEKTLVNGSTTIKEREENETSASAATYNVTQSNDTYHDGVKSLRLSYQEPSEAVDKGLDDEDDDHASGDVIHSMQTTNSVNEPALNEQDSCLNHHAGVNNEKEPAFTDIKIPIEGKEDMPACTQNQDETENDDVTGKNDHKI